MNSPVSQVVTISEAAHMYCVAVGTIRYHLDRGRLTWRKSSTYDNGVILIDLASLKALYGEPLQPCVLMTTN